MAVGWIAFFLIVALVGYMALAPSPKMNNQNTGPAEEDAFKFPTAEEGKDIPVLFGTRRCASPNVVWWGDLRSEEIVEKVG